MNYETPVDVFYKETYSCVSLHKCIDRAITSLSPGTNTITNDINPGMVVSTDKAKLSDITGLLLNTIVRHSEHNEIHVSAKLIGTITLLHIRSDNANSHVAITKNIGEIESLAKSLGGCVTINPGKMNGLAMAFTFLNH